MTTDLTVAPGDAAPDFRLPGVGATGVGVYRLSDRPEPLVVVGIGASLHANDAHRPDALAELQWFDLTEQVGVVLVAPGASDVDRVRALAMEFGIPVLADADRNVSRAYGVGDNDAIVLVDRTRRILHAEPVEGDRIDLETLEQTIDRHLTIHDYR